LASPGRVCLSQPVYDAVAASLRLPVRALGEQTLKNLSRPIRVFEVWPELGSRPEAQETAARQQIRFCTSEDEVRLAYARVGSGTTVVKAANYLNHLDYDWKSPIWRHVFQALAEKHLLIRYDERGNGMSDWNPAEISFEAFVRDLETVVDAAGLDRFALFGASQGCAVSIAYAVRHPERVTRLVLHGGYAVGPRRRGSPDEIAQRDALLTLIRQGWGQDNPAFRQMFTSLFIPDGSAEEIDWFNDLQRVSASPESATRIRRACDDIDVRELLGQVTAPTLVLHSRGDAVVPFEEGRRIASLVPGARFVALDSRNHLLLEHEPAWAQWLDEITDFLDEA
jgi:pimeloyl-ACP methyl ester carboxylesterase